MDDTHGYLWMSCNRGIYRVSKRDLNDFASGTITKITSVAFGAIDGMRDVECNGGLWPAGVRTRDGKLWFPTQDGVAVIDPTAIAYDSEPPPVVVEACLLDRKPVSLLAPVKIAPVVENLKSNIVRRASSSRSRSISDTS